VALELQLVGLRSVRVLRATWGSIVRSVIWDIGGANLSWAILALASHATATDTVTPVTL